MRAQKVDGDERCAMYDLIFLDPQTRTYDLWLCDVSGSSPMLFTFDPANDFNPVWSPDGSPIVWSSTRDGIPNLYQKAASAAGSDAMLSKFDLPTFATDWSRDGRFIIYQQGDPKTKLAVWVWPVTESGEAKQFSVVRTEANEIAGTLSPRREMAPLRLG
jgi:Tol biopolymer transport system component